IDEAFADVTQKAEGEFDKAEGLALELKGEVLEKEKLTCSVGIANNKSIAKIASDFKKPDGLTVVRPEEVRGFLDPMPVRKLLGIGGKTEKELGELGIKTVGELASQDPAKLIEIFGKNKGTFLHLSALGVDESPVEERGMSEQIGRMTTLEKDTRDQKELDPIIEELALDVYETIKQERINFKTVTITAITEDFETHTKSHTLETYADKLEIIENTAKELVKLYLQQYPKKLRRLGVRVASLTKEAGQKTLFEF
ncbi:MAG: DNA polymerase IV, partial [Planctomycetes bacterium]|nr:DNA polymerase IV [Planctomycetota bacterium]